MSVSDILKSYGPIGVDVLRNAIAEVEATGRTADSIRFAVQETETFDRLTFYGRAFFELIEKGIRPSGKNPSPEMIKFLTEYAEARGMENPKSAAWGIAKTILSEGDRTFKRGGRIVYSDDLDKFVSELVAAIQKEFAKGYLTEIKKAFNAEP